MMIVALVLGAALAALGIMAIEKKRKEGTLTYPLWQVNPLLPWLLLIVLCAAFVGSANLPRYIGLVRRGLPVQATMVSLDPKEHCLLTYRYQVHGVSYPATDSRCGIKPGEQREVYYDADAPDVSTLYLPADALRNELIAITLICLCLPTLLVLWLKATWVIGAKKK